MILTMRIYPYAYVSNDCSDFVAAARATEQKKSKSSLSRATRTNDFHQTNNSRQYLKLERLDSFAQQLH
jgi:hypothetical protein